jgi:hypothetical protein
MKICKEYTNLTEKLEIPLIDSEISQVLLKRKSQRRTSSKLYDVPKISTTKKKTGKFRSNIFDINNFIVDKSIPITIKEKQLFLNIPIPKFKEISVEETFSQTDEVMLLFILGHI